MKLTAKAAQALRRQIKTTLADEGFDGKFADIDSVIEFIEDNGLTFKAGKESLDKKMLMNILGGSIELEPAEEVAGDEYAEEEPKMVGEDDEEKGKSVRAKMAETVSRTSARNNYAKQLYASKTNRGEAGFASAEAAEIFGAWVRKASLPCLNRKDAPRVANAYQESGESRRDSEILKAHYGSKAAGTVDPTLGGSLIAEAFDTNLIIIKNEYGIARQLADVISGFEQVHNYTVDGADVAAYWVSESQAVTESDNAFLPQRIVANKLSALGRASMEIYLKPAVQIADKFATSMLRAIYQKEDLAYIDGDGSGTYGGTVGLKKRLLDLDGTPANINGLEIVATNWSGVTYAALTGLMGRVTKGNEANKKFVCSSRFYHTIIQPLKNSSAGGTTRAEIESGFRFQFEGYEVVIDNSGATPTATGTGDIPLYFGDFSLSSKMLEVSNSMRFDVSEDVYFETDEVAMKYREQVGFNVHGQGTAAEAGSYAGLYISA